MSDETTGETPTDATAYWEGRYQERDQIWSGRPNQALVDVLGELTASADSTPVPPGRALDLGSGEGGDSIWLAEQGWQVTAVDISATALARAAEHASARGVAADRITWQQADLAEWTPEAGAFELVSACFLHSPVEFPREEVLRRAAAAVAPGGHLLVVGHAGFPPWSSARDGRGDEPDAHGENGSPAHREHGSQAHGEHGSQAHGEQSEPRGHGTEAHREHGPGHSHDQADLPTPAEVLASLALPSGAWETVIAENRSRDATGPDGQSAILDDAILLLRHLPA